MLLCWATVLHVCVRACSVAISTWWSAAAAIPLMVIRLPFLWPVAARHLTNLPEAAGPGCAPPA